MSKFLNLCEEFNPKNTEDPKWKLIDFLKSKGINVSLVRNTDMLYIDTGTDTIAVNVSSSEEDENVNASTGTYEVDKTVEDIANKPMMQTNVSQLGVKMKANRAKKERDRLAGQAVDAYSKGTERIKKGLQAVKQSATQRTY